MKEQGQVRGLDWIPNPGPQERFLSLKCREALYGGAAGGGKAIDIRTLIPTARGLVPLWSVGIGDKVFTDRGEHTDVIAESEIMVGNPCYELTFAHGGMVTADAGHLWEVHDGRTWLILTTQQMAESKNPFWVRANPFRRIWGDDRYPITRIVPVESVPVKCIQVADPRGMFLVTDKYIPTHNSESLLVDAARYVGHGYGPAYHAILLRRTFKELEKSLIPRSEGLYPHIGGKFKADSRVWVFPNGERISFGHVEFDRDIMQYKSAEFQFIGWDELTEFNEEPYKYMFSRLRSSKGVPLRVRAGTNPGDQGHEWVMNRWKYWLDPTAQPKAEPGEVLYIVTEDDVERVVPKGTHKFEISRCFVPSTVEDNPYLLGTDYEANLTVLSKVEREQLRYGNWLIKPAAGLYFKRAWCEVVEAAPLNTRWVRYWDRAATENGGDWTVGVKMGRSPDGLLWVGDVVRFRHSPGGVMARVKYMASEDGRDCIIGLSEDPGAAGKFESAEYAKQLIGYPVRFNRETGKKLVRFQPFSAAAERHLVKVVKGKWNEAYFQELEAFPDVNHDDQIDASSGAMQLLTRPTVKRFIPPHLCA